MPIAFLLKREHDSVEDAKAALSLAKLRIEILENLDNFSALNKKPSFDVLHKLLRNDKTVMILDSRKNLEPIIKESTFPTEFTNKLLNLYPRKQHSHR